MKEENKPSDPKKWEKALDDARNSFDVFPSAYASAYASKRYKEMGGTWVKENNFSESVLSPSNTRKKGWVNLKNNMIVLSKMVGRSIRPYHLEMVLKHPKMFGLVNRQTAIDVLFKNVPERDHDFVYEGIVSGEIDRYPYIDHELFKWGWRRVVFDQGISSLEVDNKQEAVKGAKIISKNVPWKDIEFLHITDKRSSDEIAVIDSEEDFEYFIKRGSLPNRTDIGRTLSMFRGEELDLEDEEDLENLEEDYGYDKGWVNPKTGEVIVIKGSFHVTRIVDDPRDFGLTDKAIYDAVLKSVRDWYDTKDEREEAARKRIEAIKEHVVDVDKNIEFLAMRKGWYRFYTGDYAELAGLKGKVSDDIVRQCLLSFEKNGILRLDETKEMGIHEYSGIIGDVTKRQVKRIDKSQIEDIIKGRQTGQRTDIGRTMAMFRGGYGESRKDYGRRKPLLSFRDWRLFEEETPPVLPKFTDPADPVYPQIPLLHPELKPEPPSNPWDGIEGQPTDTFPNDTDGDGEPDEFWGAPPGTIYYPGFGWVITPVPPSTDVVIVPEGPDGFPDWEEMFIYEQPTYDIDGVPSWGVDDNGYPVFVIPGWGEWWPDPDGQGGIFFGEDGRVWNWDPINGWQEEEETQQPPSGGDDGVGGGGAEGEGP